MYMNGPKGFCQKMRTRPKGSFMFEKYFLQEMIVMEIGFGKHKLLQFLQVPKVHKSCNCMKIVLQNQFRNNDFLLKVKSPLA